MSNIYHDWLIDCVERLKMSFLQIALCLAGTAISGGMNRRELLEGLEKDYQKASAQKAESK